MRISARFQEDAQVNMTMEDAVLQSAITINGGWGKGGKVLGLAQAIEYLTMLAQDGETESFVEGYASLALHMIWVSTPEPIAATALRLVKQAMQQNSVNDAAVEFLIQHSHDRVTALLEQGAEITPNGFFALDDGTIVEGEQLLGLAGVQFISDVSDMTYAAFTGEDPAPEGHNN